MTDLELNGTYVFTVHAGGNPVDLIGTVKDTALEGDGYLITKIVVIMPDPNNQPNNPQKRMMMVPLRAINQLAAKDECIFPKTAIRMIYSPQSEVLSEYKKATGGILPANQMPPIGADDLLKKMNQTIKG